MNNYVRPEIIVSDNIAEGVYAASGNGDCWTIDVTSVQDSNGSHNVFEVRTVHSTSVQHISTASTVVLTFNNVITDAYSESGFETTFSGNTVTVVRTLLADGYASGDTVTFKVWAKSADEATTEGLAVIGKSISCTKSVNVQGGGADGN